MAARKKQKSAELMGQSDPRAPLDSGAFLAEARPVLAKLTDDLLSRADASPAVTRALEARHAAEQAAQRTAESFVTWRRSFVDQVAAAWLLSCVFVRTLEDRGLVGHARLAGPGAADSQRLFLELAPSLTERDYLLATFRELCHLPAAKELFDPKHNPVWLLAPSADAAKALLQLFRAPHADAPAFRFGQADTHFLGDLYENLNEDVRDRYALRQTPPFVESFILDRTLERAIERFGLDDTTLIDPTCGSGHFLLGAFERLVNHRLRTEPGVDVREAARRALDQVFGADINPYAVAIARFRLTLAVLEIAEYANVAEAPAFALHLVVADSLLHNPQLAQLELGDQPRASVAVWKGEEFALEDEAAARDVLHRQYAAVAGNPPYITVKDAVLRERYRTMYPRSAAGKYSVAAPFMEQFFQLGRDGAAIGMITADSFMKREFGKKLIETYLPTVDLDLVINTSTAHIPGHGTSTVLLFGRQQAPSNDSVVSVLAKRAEMPVPEAAPEKGLVWRSIADHWDEIGFDNDYITVMHVARATLSKHPWSLGGGGASELKELLEDRADKRLGDVVASIGIASFTLEDEVFLRSAHAWARLGVPSERLRPMVIGEMIRDWSVGDTPIAFFPYHADFRPIDDGSPEVRQLWPWRTQLANNKLFGGKTKVEGGLKWFEYGRLTVEKLRTPISIAFAFVATHNHFVLDRGGKVFKQSAPIIKLPESASEDQHYALLAYLNSSTACFWMKQVCFRKSAANARGDARDLPERISYEFSGTPLLKLPIPALDPELTSLGRELDRLAGERAAVAPRTIIARFTEGSAGDLQEALRNAAQAEQQLLERMKRLQAQLDEAVYARFDLSADACLSLEQPLFKRPWRGTQGVFHRGEWTHEERTAQALTARLASELEATIARRAEASTAATVCRDAVSAEVTASVAAALREFGGSESVEDVFRSLLHEDSVPYAARLQFDAAGMEKRHTWELTWSLQRREDAGENVGEIPVPPKYDQNDYRDANYWRLRGKLDVPKERFISYPGCESDEDGEPVYGWAGWDHAQRARALGSLYYKRKTEEGWGKDRLTPMLAGLLELLPWLHQWHAEPDEEYGGQSPARYFQDFLDAQCAELGLTHDDLNSWRPAEKRKKTGRRAKVEVEEQAE